ncbi:MAG: S41 family peptidase [Dehalococcoidales bacterium]
MPKRGIIRIILLLLVVSLIFSVSAGCTISTVTQSQSGPEQGMEAIEEAWNIILKDYVEKDRLDTAKLSEAAIKGMVEALDDPYSYYLTAPAYQLSRGDLRGEFEGIGAYVGIHSEQLTIISPIPGSPADKAGLRALDVILAVDDIPTLEMSLEEAVLRIRGPGGTPVRLLILHQGETEPEEIEIIRASIEIPTVTFEMKEDIAYIRIYHFSERTNEELSEILEGIDEATTAGLILDLRSNPGGFLDEVVEVTSHFIDEGIVVSVVDNQGSKEDLYVKSQDITITLPIVALSDNFSASGSEVLIGALQDHNRATIAGTKTFGKGSVNTLNRLKDGSGLYITIARWLTPNGRLIEGEGIEPDYPLELEGDDVIQWAIDFLKDKNR